MVHISYCYDVMSLTNCHRAGICIICIISVVFHSEPFFLHNVALKYNNIYTQKLKHYFAKSYILHEALSVGCIQGVAENNWGPVTWRYCVQDGRKCQSL